MAQTGPCIAEIVGVPNDRSVVLAAKFELRQDDSFVLFSAVYAIIGETANFDIADIA
jgi:hypothetical protein